MPERGPWETRQNPGSSCVPPVPEFTAPLPAAPARTPGRGSTPHCPQAAPSSGEVVPRARSAPHPPPPSALHCPLTGTPALCPARGAQSDPCRLRPAARSPVLAGAGPEQTPSLSLVRQACGGPCAPPCTPFSSRHSFCCRNLPLTSGAHWPTFRLAPQDTVPPESHSSHVVPAHAGHLRGWFLPHAGAQGEPVSAPAPDTVRLPRPRV